MLRCIYNIKAVVFVIMLSSCSSKTETTASGFDSSRDVNNTPVVTKNISISNPEIKPEINTNSLSANEIGEMILDGRLQPSDNNFTHRMIDSLNAIDKPSRKFYFKVFNKIMNYADGALSESIGNYALTYVMQNPEEFISNINNLEAERFDTWATQIGLELFLSANEPQENYNHFTSTFLKNCKGCNFATIVKLKRFNKLVWQTMQANLNAEKSKL